MARDQGSQRRDDRPSPVSAASVADIDALGDAVQNNLRRRLGTQGGSGVAIPVTLGAALKAVAFARRERDTSFGVVINTSWLTTVSIAAADKVETGFTVHFGTVAPANATIDYLVFRGG